MTLYEIRLIAVLIVLGIPVAALLGLSLVVAWYQRARAEVTARQVMLTDAVHAELGAVVSPVVEKRAFRPWRVIFALPDGRVREVGRLVAITERVLGGPRADVHIVFTRPAPASRAAAA